MWPVLPAFLSVTSSLRLTDAVEGFVEVTDRVLMGTLLHVAPFFQDLRSSFYFQVFFFFFFLKEAVSVFCGQYLNTENIFSFGICVLRLWNCHGNSPFLPSRRIFQCILRRS